MVYFWDALKGFIVKGFGSLRIFWNILFLITGALLVLAGWGTIAIQQPEFQTRLTEKVIRDFTRKTGGEISVGSVQIDFFRNVIIRQLLVKDLQDDTLVSIDKLEVKMRMLALIRNRLVADEISLDGGHNILHRLRGSGDYNFEFLLDAFGGSGKKDSAAQGITLKLDRLNLNETRFIMLDEESAMELNFLIPRLRVTANRIDPGESVFDVKEIFFEDADFRITQLPSARDTSVAAEEPDTGTVHINSGPLKLLVGTFRLKNCGFAFSDMNEPMLTGRFDGVHQRYEKLHMKILNASLIGDTILARIDQMSLAEQCGFVLNNLEGDVRITPVAAGISNLAIETPYSTLQDSFVMNYDNFHGFENFNESVSLLVQLRQSIVARKDLAYFIPGLPEVDERISVEGLIRGPLADLKGRNLKLAAGNSKFEGKFDVSGLPDVKNTLIDFQTTELITRAGDIQRWLPGTLLPQELYRLGSIRFAGTFTGFPADFVAFGTFDTQLGTLESDLNMKFTDSLSGAGYSGNLSATRFDLGRLLAEDTLLGNITFSLNVTGTGLTAESVDATVSGSVREFEFNGYPYRNAEINGAVQSKFFQGSVIMDDENIQLVFDGSVDDNGEMPVYNFSASIEEANLQAIGLADNPYTLSASLLMDMQGHSVDDFSGLLEITSLKLATPGETWESDSVILRVERAPDSTLRQMELTSDEAHVLIVGELVLTELPAAFLSIADHYLPALPGNYAPPTRAQQFDYAVSFGNISEPLHLFWPELHGIDSSEFSGHLDSEQNSFSMQGRIKAFGYSNLFFGDVQVLTHTLGDSILLTASSDEALIGDSLRILHPLAEIAASHDSVYLHLRGFNSDSSNYVNFYSIATGDTAGLYMRILPSDFVLNNQAWEMSPGNRISYSDERLIFNDFSFGQGQRSIAISNVNLRVRATNLAFDFRNIPVEELSVFLPLETWGLKGDLNGHAEILNVFRSPRISAQTHIENFEVRTAKIAMVRAVVDYIPEDDRMMLHLKLEDPDYDASIDGSYFPRRSTDQLALTLEASRLGVKLLEALLFEGLISETQGSASGTLYLQGTFDEPLLSGVMQVQSLSTRVNYLQTVYSIERFTVKLDEETIDLGTLQLRDEDKNTATVRGLLNHRHLDDFTMNISIETNRLLALNTTAQDDSIFYGKAYAAGLIRFVGRVEAMEIIANVKSLKGTSMSIPIYSGASVGQNSFIRYVDRSNLTVEVPEVRNYFIPGLRMNFNLELTPDAVVQIIFDEQAGDIIKGSGNGTIRMEIDTKGEFNIYGTYTVESGNYLFTQMNFFNKYFTLERGGVIQWNGDPYEAQIDISAIYTTKASLYELVSNTSALSDAEIKELKERTTVELLLRMTGSLFSPEISFDIQLPEVTSVSSLANIALLRIRQDENEMNKQAFAILVLGHFLPQQTGTGSSDLSTEVSNSLSEFMFNQLSYLASSVREDVDVTISYQSYETNINPTDQTDLVQRNELEVALTKRFFDDRLAVDVGGNFDFGSSGETTTGTTGVAGDFAVEYVITPDGRIKAKVFSYSDYDVIDERNKSRNGVAISYTREFDKLRELLKDPEKQAQKKAKEAAPADSLKTPPESLR